MDRIPFTANEEGTTTSVVEEIDLSWETYRPKMSELHSTWKTEADETERRRRTRKIDVRVEDLRKEGKLKADETLINVRVIHENIEKEKPIFVNYLTQSDRLAIFECKNKKISQPKELEDAFTKGMSYSGFLRSFYKEIDGAEAHGWAAVEITYDTTKPLHCGVEYIAHENLLFSWKAKDVQADEIIMRRFQVTASQLRSWVSKYNFNTAEVETLLSRNKEEKIPDPIEVFKVWIRKDGIVYVAWSSLDGNKTGNWLKTPEPMDLGRRSYKEQPVNKEVLIEGIPVMQQVMETVEVVEKESQFPVRVYIYNEGEEECITEQKGRVFMDRPWQDAQIALRSLVINGAIRASNVYASPDKDDDTGGGKLSKMSLDLEHGVIYNRKINFWSTPYPDPEILRAADSLDTRKASETGQTAAAVINRDDARKTAEELKTAKGEQAKLTLTPIMLFSGHLREVLSFCWYIVQSQAQQNKIILVPFEVQMPGPMGQMQIMIVNHPIVNEQFDIKPAGDVDVLRREERIQRESNMVPLMQGTPCWVEFLKDLIRDILPENADKYIQIIDAAEANKDQMILAMGEMLKTAVTTPDGSIKPEFASYSQQLQQMFAQLPQQNIQQNGPTQNNPGNNRPTTGAQ